MYCHTAKLSHDSGDFRIDVDDGHIAVAGQAHVFDGKELA